MTTQLELSLSEERSIACGDPHAIEFDLESYKDKSYLTHNFHPYPAKFIPQIPHSIILGLTQEGETVLDPFCGSGTALVESCTLARPAIGFDLNPLACLISRVKTTVLTTEQLRTVRKASQDAERTLPAVITGERTLVANLPEFRNRDHWFQPHVQVELSLLREIIWRIDDGPARDFLKVAFASIIVRVSNQDSDTRWVAVQKSVPRGATVRAFVDRTIEMVRRVNKFAGVCRASVRVVEHSIPCAFPLQSGSIDLIVTSPPYANSYDYYLYHKLRFFWLGLDHYSVQAKEIGSRNRHSDKNEGIATYTDAMRAALAEMSRVLRPGRFAVLVVGDAILKGQLVDMNMLYQCLAAETGFVVARHFGYDQRKFTTAFTRNFKTTAKQTHILFLQKPLR